MTIGYWFWLGVLSAAGAVLLLVMTRKGPRKMRTVHAVVLFVLLAFGGFKCAREEHVRSELLERDTSVYTVATTRNDGGGIKFQEDKKRVESVEMSYRIAGRDYVALGTLVHAYTIERDFLPQDIQGRCLLIRLPASRPDIARLEAVLNVCPRAPENGWTRIPDDVMGMIDTLWWRTPAQQ